MCGIKRGIDAIWLFKFFSISGFSLLSYDIGAQHSTSSSTSKHVLKSLPQKEEERSHRDKREMVIEIR